MNAIEFSEEVRRQLCADGYAVHQGSEADGEELADKHWFSWARPGMADAEVGPTRSTEWGAWAAALSHRLAESAIPLHIDEPSAPLAMGPFLPACLPDSALDADVLAARLGLTREAAREQADILRGQTIYMNERYQVNVDVVRAPFGPDTCDVFWLSIKRRDREAIHDWRELQAIKNRIVGDEYEGFEVYPAESRLMDTANQFHLWVFADPKVRLPVGFRVREVMDAPAAAAVGASQRPFDGVPNAPGTSGDRG